MTTFYDVPADLLLQVVSQRLSENPAINAPEWASHVKTGVHRENPPTQDDWWVTRAAAILRKIAVNGPIGVNHLAQAYGGKVDRNARPNAAGTGSRHIVRSIVQQLEDGGLIEKDLQRTIEIDGDKLDLYNGRKISGEGHRLLDSAAHSIRADADASYPGLAKY